MAHTKHEYSHGGVCIFCGYERPTKGHTMTDELDKKKQFRDAMWNYFGITEDNDLKWYEDIYESVVQPFCERECNRARIEELERTARHAGAWFRGDERLVNWVNMEIITDRIKELQSNTDGDKK